MPVVPLVSATYEDDLYLDAILIIAFINQARGIELSNAFVSSAHGSCYYTDNRQGAAWGAEAPSIFAH